ncbi:MAG: tyrosine-type recombinase/integrase [Reyranella sp.]
MRHGMRKSVDLKAAAAQPATVAPVRDLSFKELCDAYIAVVFDGADLRVRKWTDAFGSTSAWQVERETLERCVEAMSEAGYKASTINRDISQIGSIYKWAARKRMTPPGFRSPTTGIERLQENMRVVHLSDDDVKRLLAGAAAFRDRRFQAFVHLLHDTGARISEILNRRWQDVDLDAGTMLAQITKTGRPRVLFFTPATAELMRRVWPKREPNALLFEGRQEGCPITFRRRWGILTKAIGRPDLRQHDMRHHVAQRLLKGQITIAVATQILGHSSNILQKRYGHLETKALQEAALSTLRPAS